jgi:hypothetical protein
VLVNLSLILATVPRLYSFLVKIPSGKMDARLPPFVLLSRLISTNRTGTRAESNSQKKGSATSSNSTQSDGIHEAVRAEYLPSREKSEVDEQLKV